MLSVRQQRTLEAVCETLIPGAEPELAGQIEQVLSESGDLAQFAQALSLLESPLASLLLEGRFRAFSAMDRSGREAALRRWATHPLPPLRQAFQAFKRLAGFLHASAPGNPLWAQIGYPGHDRRQPGREVLHVQALRPDETTLEADAVVIGSGAGGGVAAAELAARGLHVLVLDQGGYYPEASLGGEEVQGMAELYLDRGMTATRDLSVAILAGSAVGGGTLVNWTASIAPPDWLRAEWEQEHGLTGLFSPAFQACVDEVCHRLGVNTRESASLPASNAGRLLAGCAALGYKSAELPRNVCCCGEDCGFCTFGCRVGSKQSTARTYLVDAVEHGARVIPRARVERVLISSGAAIGVAATVDGRPVTIRAPRVVMAAGAFGTPTVLLRSGLTNPQIGQHLHLHPVAVALGAYDEPVRPWSGHLLPAFCHQFARLNGNFGFLIEVAPAHPGLGALATPWQSGAQYVRELGQLDHAGVFIALVRDRDGGRVTLDRSGRRRIDYTLSAFDRQHLLAGQAEALKVHRAAGAHRLWTLHASYNALEDGGKSAVDAFIARSRTLPAGPNQLPLFSAHQMGTCRMGASPRTAVADPTGRVYGVRGLYIADGSAFPAASGVNPMITIMSLACWVAKQIA